MLLVHFCALFLLRVQHCTSATGAGFTTGALDISHVEEEERDATLATCLVEAPRFVQFGSIIITAAL